MRTPILNIILLLIFFASCRPSPPIVPPTVIPPVVTVPSNHIPFYIIMGQSNIGWANATAMTDSQAMKYGGVVPMTEIWNPGAGSSWQPLDVGINTRCENYFSHSQFGPEASLFRNLQNKKSQKRFIYKHGVGGTTLAVDWKHAMPLYTAGFRWAQFYQWLEVAAAQANANGFKLDLKGFIWMQGEDDALTEINANAYLSNLTDFFAAFDNRWQSLSAINGFPHNPYKKIIGRIHAPNAYPYRHIVRAAQTAFCAIPANNAVLINTDNYPLQDWVHFNPAGQIQFGIDIFNAIKE